MTKKEAVGVGIIAAAFTILIPLGINAVISYFRGEPDQPILMVGGSLRLAPGQWTEVSPVNGIPTYQFNSPLRVKKVEWSCSEDVDKESERTSGQPVVIKIIYSGPSRQHKIKFFTDANGQNLTAQVTKYDPNAPDNDTNPVGGLFLEHLFKRGEYPHTTWKATSMTSSGLVTDISSSNCSFTLQPPPLGDGFFLLNLVVGT
jgi:hypothetical protein